MRCTKYIFSQWPSYNPLTGTVSGFLLSQQMVQYYVLNFLILCCDNEKGNIKSNFNDRKLDVSDQLY